MGDRGPAPTPSQILKLRGSWRAEANKAEPKPKVGRPVCPKWLDKKAKAAWKQLVPQLDDMGVLTKIDGHALTMLCQTWAKWVDAEQQIQEHGSVVPIFNPDGSLKYMQQSPFVSISRSAADQLNRLFSQFGLTPSARTRIAVNDKQDTDDEKRDFLAV